MRNGIVTSIALILIIACGYPINASAEDDVKKRPEIGEKVNDFDLPIVGKDDFVQLQKEYAKGPVVVVVLRGYPTYQCQLCSSQLGALINRARTLAKETHKVFLVYPGEPTGLERHAKRFIGSRTVPEPLVLVRDPGMRMVKDWGLHWDAARETAYPATFVIKQSGRLAWSKISKSHAGRSTAEEILKELRKLK